MEYQHIVHPIAPLYNADSRILILGSFPSIKSREEMFFYGHKQNRFWKVIARLYDVPPFTSNEEKRDFMLAHRIAMWDVIYSCDIQGSSDASIRNVVPTDLKSIIEQSKVTRVYCNGSKSGEMYRKYQEALTGIPAITLPSTSPANAAWSLDKLCEVWKQILQ